MDNPAITGLSLCSGVGMLDEAVGLVLGGHHVACYCEWESGAASVLMARMEEQSLVAAPIFCGDFGKFDARPFRGVVDILTAGLPCQPYSPAGKQIGNTDARSHGEDGKSGPIPHFLRIVGECRPSVVFLENVPAWVRGGHFRPVGEELCRMGYALAHPVFLAAGDVGAAHERERVFVMAYLADGIGREWLDARAKREGGADADGRGAELADASGAGYERRLLGRRDDAEGRQDAGRSAAQCGLPLFAPAPNFAGWGGLLAAAPHLAPATQPGVCVVVDGVAVALDEARDVQLRCGGNGVVALCGAVAFEHLLRTVAGRAD